MKKKLVLNKMTMSLLTDLEQGRINGAGSLKSCFSSVATVCMQICESYTCSTVSINPTCQTRIDCL